MEYLPNALPFAGLVAALFLGALIGVERELRGHPASHALERR